MTQFKNIETPVLIEMLAEFTEKFTHLFRYNKGVNQNQEYQGCKGIIEQIMDELEKRKVQLKKEKNIIPYNGKRSPFPF